MGFKGVSGFAICILFDKLYSRFSNVAIGDEKTVYLNPHPL